MKSRSVKSRSLLPGLAFLSVVPIVAHLIYSWMGFSPTDDGFTLAYGRRILEGQVPHRDFIIIRPFLSPLIHTPFVLFGGEYTYWVSRLFVWFQFAVIAWAWVSAAAHVSGRAFSAPVKLLLGLAAFAATSQHFVITAWHTVDGLFLGSIGAWLLITRQSTGSKFSGYLLVAAAYLVKQSFVFMAPLFLLILGDWRRPRYWAASAVPGLLYVAYLILMGALPEAFTQLTSQTGVVSAGVASYLNYAVALGLLVGLAAALLLLAGHRLPFGGSGSTGAGPLQPLQATGALILAGLPVGLVTVGMILDSLSTIAFGVFGVVLGATAAALGVAAYRSRWSGSSGPTELPGISRLALLALALGWSGSLSFGYNTPALSLGPMLVALVTLAVVAYPALASAATYPRLARGALVAVGLALILSFGWSRTEYIYRQPPAAQLTEPVGEVLPGGNLIYTDPVTYAFLEDIGEGRSAAEERGKEYAIIPQAAGYWPEADQVNPLPIDWPWSVELGTEELNDRVKRDLDRERGETLVLAQKVDAFELSFDPRPATDEQYEILGYVRENWEKTGENEYFEFYE